MKKAGPPIIAALLLLLPVFYVASYLALVQPGVPGALAIRANGVLFYRPAPVYRWGDNFANRLYWPLEQIDRKVRPGAWDPERSLQLESISIRRNFDLQTQYERPHGTRQGPKL